MKKTLVVLSGAGMSAESGIQTFRDEDGLWEGHDVYTVASPEGWKADPELVLDFYNQRRKQLLSVSYNYAHQALVELESLFDVAIITQNVDDLHERAGSSDVLHLHGELLKSQSTQDNELVYSCLDDLTLESRCELGSQLRPFIVWFGEEVPKLNDAIAKILLADAVVIIGTSMQVYPAAGLTAFVKANTPIFYLDPKPSVNEALEQADNLSVISETAVDGIDELRRELSKYQ